MNWKKYLPIIGISLFIYILIKLDMSNLLSEIRQADPFFLIISIFFVPLALTTQTLKWLVIARKQKIKIPFIEAFKINLISNFYGFITPSKLGTAIRAEYLKKYTKNIGKGVSNFTLDKVLDLISIFFIAILFSMIFKDKFPFLPLNFFVIIFLIIILLTLIFIKKERSKAILKIFYNLLVPNRMKEKIKITFHSFYEDMPKKRYFILFFIINVTNWVILYLVTFLIGKSLGIDLPFVYFLAILPIGTAISLIPITINGLGTREAILITLFGMFGINAEKVFSMSILSVLVTGIIPAIIASFFILKKIKT